MPGFYLSANYEVSRQLVTRDERGKSDSFYKAWFTSFNEEFKERNIYHSGIELGILRGLYFRYGNFNQHEDFGGRKYRTYGAGIVHSSGGFIDISWYKSDQSVDNGRFVALGLSLK